MASAEAVAAVVEAGGAHVPGLMRALEDRLATIVRAHGETLGEHAGATIAAGGKRLRPLLVFVAAGPDPAGRDAALRAAVAVELVHSATLVHDDVLDAAVLRRGRPTVVASAGRSIATATGDLLFSRAFAELAGGGSPEPVRVLSDASSALVQGELLQREDAWKLQTTRARYLRRCDLKTARLFRAACELGALRQPGATSRCWGSSASASGSRSSCSTTYSTSRGPAERTGKHRGTDLLDGHGHAPADPRARAGPGARAPGPARGADTGAGRERVRRDRRDGRAAGRPRGSARDGRRGQGRPSGATRAVATSRFGACS